MANSYSLKLEESIVNAMIDTYKKYEINNTGDYVHFSAKKIGVTITIYKNKKGSYKATFSGTSAFEEAKLWDPNIEEKAEEGKESPYWINLDSQIGSDEVGVGDFLLPMIVVAAYCKKEQISRLKELGVADSKKLTDKKIKEIGPIVVKEFDYSKLTLENTKYSEMISKGENLNSLKAKMHNRALINMIEKHNVENVFVDEFCSQQLFYKYLNDDNEKKVKSFVSKTKGESWFPSVALASVIARYSFLLEVEKLNKKYNMEFPFGAGKSVDDFSKKFISKCGLEEFKKLAKTNFKNYKEIINN